VTVLKGVHPAPSSILCEVLGRGLPGQPRRTMRFRNNLACYIGLEDEM